MSSLPTSLGSMFSTMEVMVEPGKKEWMLKQSQHWPGGGQSSPWLLGFLICEMGIWSPVQAPAASPHFSVLHMKENVTLENTGMASIPVLFLRAERPQAQYLIQSYS